MPVRCLSTHARYACAHAGACCRAGWPIPIEAALVGPLRAAGITVPADRMAPTRADGSCAFFESDAGRLCTIHRRGGAGLLPSACRHFPRVIVIDPRGASITLSHFCPTAAALLFEPVPLAIVDAPSPLALDGRLEGLDATGVLPPLLWRGVLADWDGYSAWEAAAVALFAVDGLGPERAAAALLAATDRVCAWRPGRESLAGAVARAFGEVLNAAAHHADASSPRPDAGWNGHARAVNAFLAAHAFASWDVYGRDGLRGAALAVCRALDVLVGEARARGPLTRASLIEGMRSTDLRLRHASAVAADR